MLRWRSGGVAGSAVGVLLLVAACAALLALQHRNTPDSVAAPATAGKVDGSAPQPRLVAAIGELPTYLSATDARTWPRQLTRAEVVAALRRIGTQLAPFVEDAVHKRPHRSSVPGGPCGDTVVRYGTKFGAHDLCALTSAATGAAATGSAEPKHKCVFYSFGVSYDYSFDAALSDTSSGNGCRGVALDPSVTYNSQLLPQVMFLQVAARTLDARADATWPVVTTVPELRTWLGSRYIDVLKMDCEGCEYALAEDVARLQPDFFFSVGQLAIEVHVPKRLMRSWQHIHNYGLLLTQLEEAGLELASVRLTPCGPSTEKTGCADELLEAGYPCAEGIMCQNLLFARRPASA